MITLEILRTGPFAVIQDLGRAGLAHLGVSGSGAADRRAHKLANRLVANPDDRATVEVTFGGFSARVRGGDVDIAVTGADNILARLLSAARAASFCRASSDTHQTIRAGSALALVGPYFTRSQIA